MHYHPRTMAWRKIHNSSISTFLIYLNWWSTFVAGGLAFIPMLPNGCKPHTEFPFMSSWIEVFTFMILIFQSSLLSVLINKLETEEVVNDAEKVILLYHGLSFIMPIMFLLMTNVMTEWMVEASKIILQYHFGQNVASNYYNHRHSVKYIKPLGIWVATSGLCQYSNPLCMTRSKIGSCYTNYYLSSVKIFVVISIITPFMMKFLEVIVPPGIREPVMLERPLRPLQPTPELNWLSMTLPWNRRTPAPRYTGIFKRRPDDGQIPGPSSA